jgi:hypothetical protein
VSRSHLLDVLNGDRGSMLVTAAIALLAFALIGGAVLEVGQWYVHRRNVQVRTDAAALAAGQALVACFNPGVTSATEQSDGTDAYIESWATQYGHTPYNPSSDPMWFQSTTFPTASGTSARGLHNECYNPDGTPNLVVDVKMTRSGIRPFFTFSPFATVHGWARVQLQSIKDAKPDLPLAVPDVNPKAVAVTFVNNSTGNALAGCANGCVFPLTGPTTSGTLNDWGGQATIPVPSADTNVGVRVSIGSAAGSCAGVNATATYTCYDYSNGGQASTRGVVAIRSYSTSGVSGGKPMLRSVTPTSCSGTPYFSMYQAPSGTCNNVGVTAVVDFPVGATNKKVTGDLVQGNCKYTTNLTNTFGTTWVFPGSALPTTMGPYDVCLGWSYKDAANQNHSGNFGTGNGSPVQQIFSGSDGSDPTDPGGPIMAASILSTGGSPTYSLVGGTTATVAVTIGLTGGVHLNTRCSGANGNSGANYTCPSDPTVLLRTLTKTASLTYAIDCGTVPGHSGNPLAQQIQYGCANSFSINNADVCPDPANPTPTDCAPVHSSTGIKVGAVQQALNARFAPNGVCDANNYPVTDENDPRAVLLFDTDFSAFIGSGGSSSSNVPVVTFATFYVTGWNGAPAGCNNEPAPANAGSNGNSANVWGHFVKYFSGSSTPTGIKCDPTSVAPCIAALVR